MPRRLAAGVNDWSRVRVFDYDGALHVRETATARITPGDDGLLIVRIHQGAQRPADAREFRVARPGIPVQLFTNEARALEWLKGHVV